MTLKVLLPLAALLATSACLGGGDEAPHFAGTPTWQIAADPLPEPVAAVLPEGFDRSDLWIQIAADGVGYCYYTRVRGEMVPLSTPELIAAGHTPSQPFCIG